MRCKQHNNEAYCASCLENTSGISDLPILFPCPLCGYLFCVEFMKKCVGRPSVDPRLRKNNGCIVFVNDVTRDHGNKYISCHSCFVAPTVRCSERKCWSRDADLFCGGERVICPDCSASSIQDRIACPCGLAEICGDCAKNKTLHSGQRCPRCGTFYCFLGCQYIDVCSNCHNTSLCDDCMEEEETSNEESSNKGAAFTRMTCVACGHGFCTDCFEEDAVFCTRGYNGERCSLRGLPGRRSCGFMYPR